MAAAALAADMPTRGTPYPRLVPQLRSLLAAAAVRVEETPALAALAVVQPLAVILPQQEVVIASVVVVVAPMLPLLRVMTVLVLAAATLEAD